MDALEIFTEPRIFENNFEFNSTPSDYILALLSYNVNEDLTQNDIGQPVKIKDYAIASLHDHNLNDWILVEIMALNTVR